MRNPLDTVVSYFHHIKSEVAPEYANTTFDQFVEEFITGKTDWNDYWDHIVSWIEQKSQTDNILYVKYEEMKRDPRNVILKVADFMGFDLSQNPQLLDKIVHESSLDVMKKSINESMSSLKGHNNKFVIPKKMSRLLDLMNQADVMDGFSELAFIRKGIIGDYKNHLNGDQEARIKKKSLERFQNYPDLLDDWKEFLKSNSN